MNPIDVVGGLINETRSKDLNEADTRYKIIDELLDKVLSWPKSPTTCEKYINGNFADYVLYKKNGKPALVIEAKREGKYFTLPNNSNSQLLFRKINVKKLLSDPEIKDATLQLKGYCEDLGSDYGAICNGHEWIVYYFNPPNTPWKDLNASVITNLRYFSECFTEAFNFLGYHAIVNDGSLRKSVGASHTSRDEIYYPKSTITTYDAPVVNNHFAVALNRVSKNYLGNIPIFDHEFMQNCYVSHRAYHESLQNSVKVFITDSLTPYFKNLGVKDFEDNSEGGAFGKKIEEIVKRQNKNVAMILFGGRGSGKSTFIKRLLYHIPPTEVKSNAIVSVIDLLNCAQTPEELTKDIWEGVRVEIDTDKVLSDEKSKLITLFDDKYSVVKRQFLDGLESQPADYTRTLNNFLIEWKADTKYCCERLSLYWKERRKGFVIVLDNMDQLSDSLQDICFLTVMEIVNKLGCLVIISMREERYYRVKSSGVLDAYHTNGYHLSAPIVNRVLIRRLIYILQKIRDSKNIDEEFGIVSAAERNTINDFFRICIRELRRNTSALNNFLANSTHGDIRQALGYLKGFLTSGYTDITEMTSDPYWKFAKHQVIKPMMIPDRFFYDERLSQIPNLYQIRSENQSSHFTSLRVLRLLNSKAYDRISAGFLDAKFVVHTLEAKYDTKNDCEQTLNVLLEKGLIESSNRLEKYSQDIDQIRITNFGKYMLEIMAWEFTYIDLVSLDCGLYDESLYHSLCDAANREYQQFHDGNWQARLQSRIDRAEAFIKYLVAQEETEIRLHTLGSDEPRFSKKLFDSFQIEKERVLKSAQQRSEKQLH